MQAMGGLGLDRDNPQVWATSLGFDNWEIISYDRMVPIQDFMIAADMAEARQACKEVADAKFAEINAVRISPRFVHNLHKAADLMNQHVHHEPTHMGASDRFANLKWYADPTWVTVPEDRFLIGVRLMGQTTRKKKSSSVDAGSSVSVLMIELAVTDQEWQVRETVTAQTDIVEADLDSDEKPLLKESLGTGSRFFDTDCIWIPPGKRITAVGMQQHPKVNNRIALRVKVARLDGKPRKEEILTSAPTSPHYHNTQTADCKPVENPTLIDPGQVIVAMHFTEHRGQESRICVKIHTTPATEE